MSDDSILIKAVEKRRLTAGLLEEELDDLDYQNDQGWTALMLACRDGWDDYVTMLLDAKADCSLESNDEPADTAFTLALSGGDAKCIEIMAKQPGNDVNAPIDDTGFTHLMMAVKDDNECTVDGLLAAKADIYAKDKYGSQAWMVIIDCANDWPCWSRFEQVDAQE